MRGLGGKGLAWLLPVRGIELAQIARDTLLQLLAPPVHFIAREVLVAIIDGFEFTAIDGDAGLGQEPQLAAQLDELSTDLTDGSSVVFAEIGDDFVIGNETAQEP